MLTKKQIAQKSGIPTSTVKYYMDNYSEFFVEHDVDGSPYPKYEEQAVDVAKRIGELTAERKSRDEIREILAEDFEAIETYIPSASMVDDNLRDKATTIDASTLSVQNSVLAVGEALGALNRMNDELGKVIKKQEKDIETRDATIDEQQKTLTKKEAEIERLTKDNQSKDTQIAELEQKLKDKSKPFFSFGNTNE